MGPLTLAPTPSMAWAMCDWVDNGASGSPPAPWTSVFVPPPPTQQNPNFAVILQDSGNPQQYALVIQGTKNIWDALLDFNVNPVDFPPIDGAEVAMGAWDGLTNVINLTNQSGQSLNQVLFSIDWSTSNLFLAGHSLGGTLASLMAPWVAYEFFNQQQPVEQLPASIQVITFAPFAAGNQPLAEFLDGQSNYQANFNTIDAVPHVWATVGQYSVPNMYTLFPSLGPRPMPTNLQSLVQNKVNRIPPGFSYVQTIGNSFTFQPVKVPFSGLFDPWLWELSYQHNVAYATQFAANNSSVSSEDDGPTKELRRASR